MSAHRPSTPRLALAVVGMNTVWLASVLCAAQGLPWIGPVLAIAFAGVMLSGSKEYLADTWLIVLAIAAGLIADSLLYHIGLIAFPEPANWGKPVPLWMLGLWINLAAALPACLYWLIDRPGLAAIFGLIGGPAAYYSGQQFGAITVSGLLAYLIVGIAFALAMILFSLFTAKTRGLTQKSITPAPAPGSGSGSGSGSDLEPNTNKNLAPLPGAGAEPLPEPLPGAGVGA